MGCYLKRPQLQRAKQEGIVYECDVSMGCYLKRPQLPHATWSSRGSSQFQWAATSNALSYTRAEVQGLLANAQKFQWAATSNALSYPLHSGRVRHDATKVSMGCYLKRPQLRI